MTALFTSPRANADCASASGLDAWGECAATEPEFWCSAIAELKQNNWSAAVTRTLPHNFARNLTATISPGSQAAPNEALMGEKIATNFRELRRAAANSLRV